MSADLKNVNVYKLSLLVYSSKKKSSMKKVGEIIPITNESHILV